jgi:hypothetical protein
MRNRLFFLKFAFSLFYIFIFQVGCCDRRGCSQPLDHTLRRTQLPGAHSAISVHARYPFIFINVRHILRQKGFAVKSFNKQCNKAYYTVIVAGNFERLRNLVSYYYMITGRLVLM